MQLLIYNEPVLLNRGRHKKARIASRQVTFECAAALNSIPLTTPEFVEAGCDYPIVFAGSPEDASMPAALLGLGSAENLFVDGAGNWDPGTYLPAFLRRYPFVVAEHGEPEQFSVCLERAYMSDREADERLFTDDGDPAPVLLRAMKFLSDYQAAVDHTKTFMQQLRDSGLLVARTVKVERPGADEQSLHGFSVVDEARLAKLGAKALKELMRTGALGLIYCHIASLERVKRLARRRDESLRQAAMAAEASTTAQ